MDRLTGVTVYTASTEHKLTLWSVSAPRHDSLDEQTDIGMGILTLQSFDGNISREYFCYYIAQ